MRTPLAAILPVALLTAAFAAPAAAQSKIGVISEPALLREAPQIEVARQKFTNEFQKREDELKAEAKKLTDDDKRFQREADTMSAQQRATTSKDLYTRKTDFDLKQRQFAEQAQTRNNELQRDVLVRINRAIAAVAQEKGLDLVVRDPAFANPALDITGDVLKKLAAPEAKPAAEPKKKK
ncbi:MAG: OmpH family outer membrane protein [Arenimonas sp.]